MTIRELEPFAYGYYNSKSENISMRIAEGIYTLCECYPLTIDTDVGLIALDYFNGGVVTDLAVYFDFGSGINVRRDVFERYEEQYPELKEEIETYKNYFDEVATDGSFRKTWSDKENALYWVESFSSGDWIGHSNPDFGKIVRLGTSGIRAEVENYSKNHPEKEEFYRASLLVLDAIDLVAERFKEKALELADLNDEHKPLYLRIAEALNTVPKLPATDFFTACQSFYLLYTLDGKDSPGCFDQYMIDYYRKSDPEDAREILEKMWLGFLKVRAWNLCISGSDKDWNDLTNELTYLILDVAEKYKFVTPNLTMRVHRNTPDKLLKRAAEVIGSGVCMPVLYNDEVVCPALEALGIPPEDSHLYVMNGCNQIDIFGKSHMGLEDGEVCLLKCLEFALSRGKCLVKNQVVSIDTGDPAEFKTYEDLWEAYKKQVEYITGVCVDVANKYQKHLSLNAPNPLRTMFIEGCLEKGVDYKAGGPLYNQGQILIEAMSDTADSFACIKHFVFDTGKYTMSQVAEALEKNYEGYEEMFEDFRKYPKKFGNDIEEVDNIAGELFSHFASVLSSHTTFRSGNTGIYGPGMSTFDRTGRYGMALGASANGRKARDITIADSIGPVPGRDVKGPTAVIKSALKYDQKLAKSGFVLQLKFDREMFMTENGINGFVALVKAYFKNGGQQLTVTVVNPDELIDAQNRPELYGHLIVRVGGYSDYFIYLPKDLQDNIIARTTHLF